MMRKDGNFWNVKRLKYLKQSVCSRLFEAGKTKGCDGEMSIDTAHFYFSLIFHTCLFSGVKHNTSFLWKIKKKLSYNQKIQCLQKIKCMTEIPICVSIWYKGLLLNMLTECTFFHRKKVFLKIKFTEIWKRYIYYLSFMFFRNVSVFLRLLKWIHIIHILDFFHMLNFTEKYNCTSVDHVTFKIPQAFQR